MTGARAVGSVGAARSAWVDGHGGISVDGSAVSLEWWIGAEDRWRIAAAESAVRQHRLAVAPAYETAMRVPSGDVVQRVYAVGGAGDPIVVEFENDSPAPVALALVARGLGVGIDLSRARIELDRRLRLHATKPAAHAIGAADVDVLLAALERGEGAGTPPDVVAGAGVVALVQPLAHRTRTRFALVLDTDGATEIDLVSAPDADAAARGWDAMLRRGLQVVFADPARQTATDEARADLLLAAGRTTVGSTSAGPEVFTALEDWGFDTEAVEVWRRLGWRARRRAARRSGAITGPSADDVTGVLQSTRDALIAERTDGVIVLAPEPPRPGEALEVHAAPTRAGSVSYAIRWHGPRPALLWDVQAPSASLRLVAPALDPAWSTDQPAGEVLLGDARVDAADA